VGFIMGKIIKFREGCPSESRFQPGAPSAKIACLCCESDANFGLNGHYGEQ